MGVVLGWFVLLLALTVVVRADGVWLDELQVGRSVRGPVHVDATRTMAC